MRIDMFLFVNIENTLMFHFEASATLGSNGTNKAFCTACKLQLGVIVLMYRQGEGFCLDNQLERHEREERDLWHSWEAAGALTERQLVGPGARLRAPAPFLFRLGNLTNLPDYFA